MSEDPNAIYIATETFAAEVDGVPYLVRKGLDRVRGSHPLYRQTKAAGYWAPVTDKVTYDVEQATSDPGEKRGQQSTTINAPAEAISADGKAAAKGKSKEA